MEQKDKGKSNGVISVQAWLTNNKHMCLLLSCTWYGWHRQKWRESFSHQGQRKSAEEKLLIPLLFLPVLSLSPRRMDLLNPNRETCRQRYKAKEKMWWGEIFLLKGRRRQGHSRLTRSLVSACLCLMWTCIWEVLHIKYYSIVLPIGPVQTQTSTQIATPKHLLPPELSGNPQSPPLSSYLHSSCYSFCLLPFHHDFICPPLLFEAHIFPPPCTPRTKQRQTHCYFLLLTVPSSFSHLICSLLCPCYSHT